MHVGKKTIFLLSFSSEWFLKPFCKLPAHKAYNNMRAKIKYYYHLVKTYLCNEEGNYINIPLFHCRAFILTRVRFLFHFYNQGCKHCYYAIRCYATWEVAITTFCHSAGFAFKSQSNPFTFFPVYHCTETVVGKVISWWLRTHLWAAPQHLPHLQFSLGSFAMSHLHL